MRDRVGLAQCAARAMANPSAFNSHFIARLRRAWTAARFSAAVSYRGLMRSVTAVTFITEQGDGNKVSEASHNSALKTPFFFKKSAPQIDDKISWLRCAEIRRIRSAFRQPSRPRVQSSTTASHHSGRPLCARSGLCQKPRRTSHIRPFAGLPTSPGTARGHQYRPFLKEA